VKSIASNNGGAPRYRLHLSDGGDIVQAMLNTGHGPVSFFSFPLLLGFLFSYIRMSLIYIHLVVM